MFSRFCALIVILMCSSRKSGTRHTVGIYPVNLASGWQFTVKPLQINALKTSILLNVWLLIRGIFDHHQTSCAGKAAGVVSVDGDPELWYLCWILTVGDKIACFLFFDLFLQCYDRTTVDISDISTCSEHYSWWRLEFSSSAIGRIGLLCESWPIVQSDQAGDRRVGWTLCLFIFAVGPFGSELKFMWWLHLLNKIKK